MSTPPTDVPRRADQQGGESHTPDRQANAAQEAGHAGTYRPFSAVACADPTEGGIAGAGREVLVVNKLAGRVQFFARSGWTLLAELEMESFPHEVVVDPGGRLAYVSIYGRGVFGKNSEQPGRNIAVIDLSTRQQVRSIDVSPWRGPHGMAFDEQGVLWVSCDVSGVVLAVDATAGEILSVVPSGSFGTHWLVACHARNKVYASNKTFDFLCVIDSRERKLIGRIPFPHGSEGLALSPLGDRLYVTAQRPQMMAVIDTQTDAIIEEVSLAVFSPTPPERNPQKRVRVSPDGRWLLLTSFNTGEIVILPGNDLRAQRLFSVEKGPMGITFADSNHAFVMNHDQGTVWLINVQSGQLVDRFVTAAGPETLAMV